MYTYKRILQRATAVEYDNRFIHKSICLHTYIYTFKSKHIHAHVHKYFFYKCAQHSGTRPQISTPTTNIGVECHCVGVDTIGVECHCDIMNKYRLQRQIYTYISVYLYIHIHIFIYLRVYVLIYVYIYTYTYVTYIHKHSLHRTVALDPNGKYIFGYHPHGIIGFGGMTPFVAVCCNYVAASCSVGCSVLQGVVVSVAVCAAMFVAVCCYH